MQTCSFHLSAIALFLIAISSLSAHACFRNSRQLSALSERILKHHGNQREKQQALVRAFKDSIPLLDKSLKPDVLQRIVGAVSIKNPFQGIEKNKKIIYHAIEEFHAVPGFLILISRILDGAISRNTANFSGALGELKAAVEKKKQRTKIIAFNERVIDDADGRTLTEIDLLTQDENGAQTWQEIKTRNKLRKKDPEILYIQRKKQRDLARKAGAKHTFELHCNG